MREKTGLKQGMFILVFALMLGFFMIPHRVSAAVLDGYGNGKVYDVTEYGADKSGKKNSSAAVDKAIAAAKQDIRKGFMDGKERAVLYFPSGKYKVGSRVKLLAGMAVVAEKDSVINFSGKDGIQMFSISGCTIEGGTWQGNNSSTVVIAGNGITNLKIMNLTVKSGYTGINLYNCTATVKNVSISKCKNIGMNVTAKSKATVSNCKINNNGSGYPKKGLGHGIGVYNKSTLTLSNSQTNKNRECGVSVMEATATIKKCLLQNNGRHAVGTAKVCKITMKDCDIYRNGYKDNLDGVSLVQGTKGTFTNCKFRENAVTGLLVNHGKSSAVVKNCTFKGNVVHNIYSENLVSGTVKIEINGCKFYKCKSGESVKVYVNKKSGYSVKIKGNNKYYNVKPKYAYQVKDKVTYKN